MNNYLHYFEFFLKVKLNYRFSGFEFPPSVVFKIYSQMQDGRTSKHITGKDMIKPASSVIFSFIYMEKIPISFKF